MIRCAWCRQELGETAVRVPSWAAIPASVAMAFMHGGLWAQQELSRPYCPPCRRKMIGVSLLFSAIVLAVAGCGAAVWLSGPGR